MKLYDEAGNEIGIIYDAPKKLNIEIYTTKEKLQIIFNQASPQAINDFYEIFSENARYFSIMNRQHEDFFLTQIVAETGYDLVSKRENLNYTPSALRSTFSRYKRNPQWSERDGRTKEHSANQVNIANIAYANRIGNGDIASGDGYKFRGGGFFQLTGRANYERISTVIQQTLGDAIDADILSEKIETVRIGCLSAMAFWLDKKCYLCSSIDCVTRKINRYTDTYDKRREIYDWISKL